MFWAEGKTCDAPKKESHELRRKEVKGKKEEEEEKKMVAGVKNEHQD